MRSRLSAHQSRSLTASRTVEERCFSAAHGFKMIWVLAQAIYFLGTTTTLCITRSVFCMMPKMTEEYAMGEREEPGALWRFGDSPFTWGGIGVIVGSAIVSPTWFKFAFVGGGMAIAIGILRAKPFNGRSSRFRFAANLALLACLGIGWRLLWKVIPAPVEPLTKQEAQELFRQNANQSQPVSQIPPPEDARSPLTKADFLKLLQQYKFAGNTVGNDKIPSLPAVTPNPQALGLSGQRPGRP